MLRGKRTFPPSLAGKASTICQVFLMYYVLYLNAVGKSPESLAWLYILTALLTAFSWVQYGFVGIRMLRGPRLNGPVPSSPRPRKSMRRSTS